MGSPFINHYHFIEILHRLQYNILSSAIYGYEENIIIEFIMSYPCKPALPMPSR
jgi:hypothetical protein